jgi:cytochrome c553
MRGSVLAFALLLGACGSQPRNQQAAAETTPIQFSRASADQVAHGERVARVLGCIGCHGETLTGNDWSEAGTAIMWSSNLTRVVRRHDDRAMIGMITGGVRPDGSPLWEMPSHLFTRLATEDMTALLAFLRSRPEAGVDHPRPRFEARGRREIGAGSWRSAPAHVAAEGRQFPPDAGPRHALARYIVRATCAECHGMTLVGGQPHPGAAPRPDIRLIVAGYERAQFRRLLRDGVAAGDRTLGLMGQVARGRYRHLTATEVDAIYDYLHALGTRP